MAQEDKKKSVCCTSYSGTIHHVILIYGTHVKKNNISKFFLHLFQFLIFRVNNWAKEKKMAWNDNYVCGTPYLSKHASFDCVFCYASSKWWHSRWFVHFLQILVFSVVSVGGWGGKKFCLAPYLWNCISYDCVFWYTCVKWWYLQ